MKGERYMNKRLTDLARHACCSHCGADDGTIVAAHSNFREHGKGAHRKADDCFVAFLCNACHSWIDQGKGRDPLGLWECTHDDKREMFTRAMHATWAYLWRNNLVRVA